MLSRTAELMAMEIRNHDWSDAPYRVDRAGHRRDKDTNSAGITPLDRKDTEDVLTNVMFVTAQVLGSDDPNFDPMEYAKACGVPERYLNGFVDSGIRKNEFGLIESPETWAGQERAISDPRSR